MAQPNISLQGLPVQLSGTGRLQVGYGLFSCANTSTEPVHLYIEELSVQLSDENHRPTELFIMLPGDTESHPIREFPVPPGDTIEFRVFFAPQSVDAEMGTVDIRLKCKINDQHLEAVSPVSLTRRIPRR